MANSSAFPTALVKLSRNFTAAYPPGQFVGPTGSNLFEVLLSGATPLPPSVSAREVATAQFLKGIQGNIVRPHGRAHSALLFFRHRGTFSQMRTFLAEAGKTVTTAYQQLFDAQHRAERPFEPFISMALTAAGVGAARIKMPANASTPSGDDSFATGMWAKRGNLGDDLPWEETSFTDDAGLHGVWLLANDSVDRLAIMKEEIRRIGGGLIAIVHEESGVALRDNKDLPVEPFGFRDGISMPEFFVEDQAPAALINLPLNQVLIESDGPERGGSFLVFRKLQQHVAEFRKFEQALLAAAPPGFDPVDPGRLLIGRTRDGQPLVPLDPGAVSTTRKDHNQFDFAHGELDLRCPFHAHIRKANPRSTLGRVPLDQDDELRAQIVRRSAVYGRQGKTLYEPQEPPLEKTGLLFLAYMADIARQFEFIQLTWMSNNLGCDGHYSFPDPLIYGGRENTTEWRWAGLPNVTLPLQRFVTALGGAYLFAPPLAWLHQPPQD